MVGRLDNHIETLAREGERVHWMKPGVAHLRWPKCSAFHFDGMAVPFNHQNEWAYSLFNAAEFREVDGSSSALNDHRDIIRFFLNRLGDGGGFPRTENWYYWYGQAFDGWRVEDHLSCNIQSYAGDRGLAWISFRSIDFMSVMSSLNFIPDLNRSMLLQSGYDAVKYGDVYPFAARSLIMHGTFPQIQLNVLRRYSRATAPWELANLPWALSLAYAFDEK